MMEIPPVSRWAVVAELRPLSGGHRNRAFRTIGLSRDLVFKSTQRNATAIEWLGAVHALAKHSGFVVPDLLRSRHGRLVESGWTCEEFIPGRAFTVKDMPSIRQEISRFHRRACEVMQRPGFLSSQDLLTDEVGGDINLAMMPPDLVETCRRAWRNVLGGSCTVIHGDLNPGNLIRCPDGRAALLDWDELPVRSRAVRYRTFRACRPHGAAGAHCMGGRVFLAA